MVEQELEMFLVLLEITPEQRKYNGLTIGQFETQIFIKDVDCKWLLTTYPRQQ